MTKKLPAKLLPPQGLGGYAAINFVDTVGTGMFVSGSVVYFRTALGLSAGQIGFGLSLGMLLALAAPLPAGRLGDRVGDRMLLAMLHVVIAALFAVYPFVGNYQEFLVVVSAIAFGQAAQTPVRRGVISRLVAPGQRVRASAYSRAVANAGFTLGMAGAASALALGGTVGLRLIVLVNAASYLAAGVATTRLRLTVEPPTAPTGAAAEAGGGSPYRDRRFFVLSVLSGLIMTHESLLAVGLPLYVVRHHVQGGLVPVLLAGNAVLAVLFQVRVGRNAEDLPGGRRALMRAALLLACCTAVLAAGSSARGVLLVVVSALALVILTGGELLSSAGAWSVSYALSDGPRRGERLGLFSTVQQATAVAGPTVVAMVVDAGAPGWLLLMAFYLLLALGVHRVLGRPAPSVSVAAPTDREVSAA